MRDASSRRTESRCQRELIGRWHFPEIQNPGEIGFATPSASDHDSIAPCALKKTPGVAFAEPTDSGSTSSSSDSSSSTASSSSESAASTSSTVRRRQQIRRPQRPTPRQVRRLGLFRIRLTRKPVRPPHRVTLRRQTRALVLCRVRAARTPVRHRRAATPPHQPGRRPAKPVCPPPSPRLHPPSHRPPRCPTQQSITALPTEPDAPAPSAEPVPPLVSNITSVTDSAGNTYQLAVPTARGSGGEPGDLLRRQQGRSGRYQHRASELQHRHALRRHPGPGGTAAWIRSTRSTSAPRRRASARRPTAARPPPAAPTP